MKNYKEPCIYVSMCWEVGKERKCVTMPKEKAYITRDWVEKNKGVTYWFQPVN